MSELPYQVNKARLIEKIAELVREKRLDGISELRDESDKDGMRVVIELRRGELSDVVLNNLYKQTPLQSVFGTTSIFPPITMSPNTSPRSCRRGSRTCSSTGLRGLRSEWRPISLPTIWAKSWMLVWPCLRIPS